MTADLALVCQGCRQTVEGDSGSLRVTFAAILACRGAEQAQRARAEGHAVDIAEFLLGPEDVHWRAYHDQCDPESDEPSYQIDSGQLRTWRDLARWTAHLMAKNWFQFTDWDCLLREAAGETEASTIRVLERQP